MADSIPPKTVSKNISPEKRTRLCEYRARLDTTHLLEMHETMFTTANGDE
jgi:hypothetical protein